MNLVICPHCNSHRIVTAKVPKDVVVIMPCPSCGELVVLFRKKAVAIDREILEKGTKDERTQHLAGIIAEFLEPGMFGFSAVDSAESADTGEEKGSAMAENEAEEDSQAWVPPISESEFDEFVKVELERLDDATYFKKHFGKE